MASIIINKQNFSNFSKRLMKVINANFDEKVKLNQAQTLLSKTLGKDSTYEIQKCLEDEENTLNLIDVKAKEYALTILESLETYFQKENTDLEYTVSYQKEFNVYSLNIHGRDAKFPEDEFCFGLHFNSDNPYHYIEKELKHLKHTKQDNSRFQIQKTSIRLDIIQEKLTRIKFSTIESFRYKTQKFRNDIFILLQRACFCFNFLFFKIF